MCISFSCSVLYCPSGAGLIVHPHLLFSGSCGCTFLHSDHLTLPDFSKLRIRIPYFPAVADALFTLLISFVFQILPDCTSASLASRLLRMHLPKKPRFIVLQALHPQCCRSAAPAPARQGAHRYPPAVLLRSPSLQSDDGNAAVCWSHAPDLLENRCA